MHLCRRKHPTVTDLHLEEIVRPFEFLIDDGDEREPFLHDLFEDVGVRVGTHDKEPEGPLLRFNARKDCLVVRCVHDLHIPQVFEGGAENLPSPEGSGLLAASEDCEIPCVADDVTEIRVVPVRRDDVQALGPDVGVQFGEPKLRTVFRAGNGLAVQLREDITLTDGDVSRIARNLLGVIDGALARTAPRVAGEAFGFERLGNLRHVGSRIDRSFRRITTAPDDLFGVLRDGDSVRLWRRSLLDFEVLGECRARAHDERQNTDCETIVHRNFPLCGYCVTVLGAPRRGVRNHIRTFSYKVNRWFYPSD